VMQACIFAADGKVLATYSRDPGAASELPQLRSGDAEWIEKDSLFLTRSVQLDGETVGTIFLKSDLGRLHQRVARYEQILGLVMIGALAAAFLLSFRLQRVVSGPIQHLAETAKTVSSKRDYSIRAVKTSEDQLGMLMDSFNEMLGQIQSQDQ